jgi:outer membrane protein assembly factor BamD
MADYELLVGEFYMKKGSYSAAIGRFEPLLKKFKDYKNEEKVLYNLGFSYKESDQDKKATAYFNTLLEKYPESEFKKDVQEALASLKSGKK